MSMKTKVIKFCRKATNGITNSQLICCRIANSAKRGYVIERMEKISRFIGLVCLCFLFFSFLQSCKSHDFIKIENKVAKYSERVYVKRLKKYGNASMINPEGWSSDVWYYDNNKIHIEHIARRGRRIKITSKREYDCDSLIDIKEYKESCFHKCEDISTLLRSSMYDAETDSVYELFVMLDMDKLVLNGHDSLLVKKLREHIIKYNLWEMMDEGNK